MYLDQVEEKTCGKENFIFDPSLFEFVKKPSAHASFDTVMREEETLWDSVLEKNPLKNELI